MDLKDYPRPPKDTGIGVHWTPGNSGLVGAGELRKKWIPQLQRMGVKWVKMLHSGGLQFAEMLLESDIMPVVRIYRHRPNTTDLSKAVLRRKEIEQLKEYIAVGVKYFEFNNEPELAGEWQDGKLPEHNAVDYVARAAIVDMETILGLGGYPAVPALAIGSQWDLIGKIIEHGGDYLFDEPVWLAVHNYDLNHPLNYPYDRVNRFGEQLTPEEYRAIGGAAWTGSQWGNRTLAFVNEERKKNKNPRPDLVRDASGFMAYERLAALSLKHLGRHLPIISTENGPIVGEDPDPRYPTTTPEIHAQKVVDIAEIMMGVSQQYDPAPDYYFATAFWLMGASVLRAKGWEGNAWFAPIWPGGHLPAVDALEKLPKQPRQFEFESEGDVLFPSQGPHKSVVSGVVHGYANMRVILRSAGYAADAYTDDTGRFRIGNLPAGSYRLSVPGAGIVKLGIELDGENQVEIELGEPAPEPKTPDSASGWRALVEDVGASSSFGSIRVSVEGKVGLPVRISADGWEGYIRETGSKSEYGPFALEFSPLGPGVYRIEPEGLGVAPQVRLGSKQIVHVFFRPLEVESEKVSHHSRIDGVIVNGAGMRVLLYRDGELVQETVTNNDGSFSFKNLPAGEYHLQAPDIKHEQSLKLDGENQVRVELTAPAADIPRFSTISGRVMHGVGRRVMLKGPEGEQVTEVDQDEYYIFEHLGPGRYYVRVIDTLLRRGGLRMTGRNHRVVNFAMPVAAASGGIIFGHVPQGAGWQIYLRGPNNKEIIQPLDENGHFQIVGLAPGEYELILQGDESDFLEHVTLQGDEKVEVVFDVMPPDTSQVEDENSSSKESVMAGSAEQAGVEHWAWTIEAVGSTPGYAVIRVRIPHHAGLPVRLWSDDWEGMVRVIGDDAELGPDACEFAPLGIGVYYLQPAGFSQIVTIEVSGSHEIWVTFTPGPDSLSPVR